MTSPEKIASMRKWQRESQDITRLCARNNYCPWTLERDIELIKMHTAGVSFREMARVTGRTYSAIRKRINYLNKIKVERDDESVA